MCTKPSYTKASIKDERESQLKYKRRVGGVDVVNKIERVLVISTDGVAAKQRYIFDADKVVPEMFQSYRPFLISFIPKKRDHLAKSPDGPAISAHRHNDISRHSPELFSVWEAIIHKAGEGLSSVEIEEKLFRSSTFDIDAADRQPF